MGNRLIKALLDDSYVKDGKTYWRARYIEWYPISSLAPDVPFKVITKDEGKPFEFSQDDIVSSLWLATNPFKSYAQEAYMKHHHPKIYAHWKKQYGLPKHLPQHVKHKGKK